MILKEDLVKKKNVKHEFAGVGAINLLKPLIFLGRLVNKRGKTNRLLPKEMQLICPSLDR